MRSSEQAAGQAGRHARSVLCDNPSPMTLDGTLTYVLGGPDDDVVLVDPGPDGNPEHLDAVAAVVGERRVRQILVTHRHHDHTGAAAAFATHFAAPVRGFSAEQCRPEPGGTTPSPLTDGEVIDVGGRGLEVLHTPGHTSDSVCLWLPPLAGDTDDADDAGAMLTGDTLLGAGTTMLDHPDGTLSDYLHSLHRLSGHSDAALLPAHGPRHAALGPVVRDYLDQRHARLDQMRELLRTRGRDTPAEELSRLIYGDVPVPEAVLVKITEAHLDHLRRLGEA